MPIAVLIGIAEAVPATACAQAPLVYLYAARFGPYGDHLTGLGIGLYRVERAP